MRATPNTNIVSERTKTNAKILTTLRNTWVVEIMFVEGGATEHETLKIKEKVLLKMARRKMPQPNTKILEIQKSRVVLDRTSGRNRPQQNKTILQKNNQKLDSLVECTP